MFLDILQIVTKYLLISRGSNEYTSPAYVEIWVI